MFAIYNTNVYMSSTMIIPWASLQKWRKMHHILYPEELNINFVQFYLNITDTLG